MPEWIKSLQAKVIAIAVTVAALASGAAGWAYFGLFTPMSVEMHSQYHGHEQALADGKTALAFANKQLGRFEPGTEAHTEALAFRDLVQSRLDVLEGS